MITQTARIGDEEQKSSFYVKTDFIRKPEDKIPESQLLSYLTADPSHSSLPPITYDSLAEKTISLGDKGIMPQIMMKKSLTPESGFISLQKWEGVVTEIGKEFFFARLYDLTNKGNEEEAEFSVDEISEDERDLFVSGAVFYWNIGYHDSYTGQIEASANEADALTKSIVWK
jgi:hypothetical protein